MRMGKIALVLALVGVVLAADAYSSRLAARMTHFSAIAYESEVLIENWTCDLCNGISFLSAKVVFSSSNSVYGYVGYSPEEQSIVVAFRGSVDTANWILNLKTTRTSYDLCDGCSVHVGFNQGFNSVKAQVDAHISYLLSIYRQNRFMVTGHSLGGALGVMAAAHIQNIYGNVVQLYTMGQPRVGNDKFAAFMTGFIPNTYRIIDYADQVPHVPQSILGFKHEGFEIWYQRGMQEYKICPSESKECSNQLNILQLTQADHKMVLYLQLKVADGYWENLSNKLSFYWMDYFSRGKTFNLDIKTMLEEDRQIKEWRAEAIRQTIVEN